MGTPRFDPSHSVKFDLQRGHVDLDGSRLLVPAEALLDLCRAAGQEPLADFGRRMGTEVGRRVQARLGDATRAASIGEMVEHLGGDVALLGLGSLSVERWGRALVFVVDGSPLGSAGDALLGAVLEGALQRGLGKDVHAVLLDRQDEQARFAILGAAGAEKAEAWLGEGVRWGEVLSRLQGAA